MATAMTSSVIPKAIPVCRIIRLAVTKSLLGHLNEQVDLLGHSGGHRERKRAYFSGFINGVGMITI